MSTLAASLNNAGVAAVADGFGDHTWFEAWYEAFRPTSRRYPLSASGVEPQHDLVDGMMKVFRRRVPCLSSPANSHTPRYGWKLNGTNAPDLPSLNRSLREMLSASGRLGIEFRLLVEGGGTVELLRSLSVTGDWIVDVDEAERAHLLDVEGNWEARRKELSSNLMKSLNWKENKLRRLGRFSFLEVGQREDWGVWLDRALELEAAGWKGLEGSAILHRPNEATFYRRIAEAAAAERRLRLYVLTIDERLVAFQILLLEDGILYLLKLAYDETFGTYSPGHVLQRLIVKECHPDPSIRALDLGGPGEWKLRWSPRIEPLMRVRLAPAGSLVGYLLRAERAIKRVRDRFTSIARS